MVILLERFSSAVWRFGSLVTLLLVMFPAQPATARPYRLGDHIATARCRNLLPNETGAVMNGVFVAPGATQTVLVSRSDPVITIQLVVTGKPLNRALNAKYTVPIAQKLVNAPRILFVLELTTCQSSGCEGGDLCLKTPSLLGYFGFQRCTVQGPSSTASILEDGEDEISVAPPSITEPNYLKQIQMVGLANHEIGSPWSSAW
ncbi:hypothetical protein KC19_3G021800 [Ceratodon purpureus]|uniref:Uncharacterized protein n=1 Tax=Ceratodon purpureus TaxID=3225 RepID=A0A8T0IGA9_CERPU|nr:hypothetical protein KC19_3G021800 [Ceratodon purpureus]